MVPGLSFTFDDVTGALLSRSTWPFRKSPFSHSPGEQASRHLASLHLPYLIGRVIDSGIGLTDLAT